MVIAADRSEWEWMDAGNAKGEMPFEACAIVQHFTAGGPGRAIARWVAGKARVDGKRVPAADYYAHVIVCRDGHVIQQAGFDERCNHAAGRAHERFTLPAGLDARTEINDFALGIENSNYGWLMRKAGVFYVPRKRNGAWGAGKRYPGSLPAPIRAEDHKGVVRWWEPFADELLRSNEDVLQEMLDQYPDIPRENVVRHSELSPDRKMDPGPLFPFDAINVALFDDDVFAGELEELIARRLYDGDAEICVMPSE